MKQPSQQPEPPPLRAPFPYFGGKSRVANLVWSRFGDTRNYVEPFAGSLAVLLCRPHWPWAENRTETVNDADCFLANFWRSLQQDPEEVAHHADWPVNEADLHARHQWLVNVGRLELERMHSDPSYYDAKIAGWWVWGCCQWIGSGWCHHPDWQQRPHLGNSGRGVHRPSQKLPHLGDAGRGVHRASQQRPHLGDAGMGVHRATTSDLLGYFRDLAARLRRVRVCCGDWSRVCGPTPTVRMGLTAVFLDPPYTSAAGRKSSLYARDDESIGHEVRAWAVEHGDDPKLRIALCGYDGEYDMPASWECVPWKSHGGYASQGKRKKPISNAAKERIWFSPHCLKVTQ